MTLSPKHVTDLVVATLSVNSYPVTSTWELLPALGEQGLLDFAGVAARAPGELIDALERAGYRRGKITWIVAPRLQTLMSEVGAGKLDGLSEAVSAGDETAATELLTAIRGVGPRVAATAWMLLTSEPAK